jgi:hypothetical protein
MTFRSARGDTAVYNKSSSIPAEAEAIVETTVATAAAVFSSSGRNRINRDGITKKSKCLIATAEIVWQQQQEG